MDLSLADVLIAGLAAILGWFVANRSYQASLDQYRLDAATTAADWMRDLRSWAGDAIDVLAEAAYHSPGGERGAVSDTSTVLKKCRCRLSALIDRGRLFLPNERTDKHGQEKPAAYRGVRHAALDGLVAAERLLGGDADLDGFPDRKAALIGVRREFVSTIQAIVDPQSHNREVAKLLQLAALERRNDPTVGGLLPNPDKIPSGDVALLALASKRYERDPAR